MDRNVKEEGVTESRVLFQQGKERSEAQRACCPVEMSFQKNPLDLGLRKLLVSTWRSGSRSRIKWVE